MNARTARQWIVPHEWMVVPMRQVDWIDTRGGRLVWLANVFEALGTGLYLVALCAASWWATLVGWLLIMLVVLPLRLFSIGRPLRFWRAIPPFTNAWRTSWFARGTFFCVVFVPVGAVQLLASYLLDHHVTGAAGGPLDVVNWITSVAAGVFIVLVGVYVAFAMSYCRSVPFWNTALLPVVLLVTGITDGLALLMAIGLVTDDGNLGALEWASRIGLIAAVVLVVIYLARAWRRSPTAEFSTRDLLMGRTASVFWVGVVGLGIASPLTISVATLFAGSDPAGLLITAVVAHTIGAFALKYSVLKVGIYRPLLAASRRRPRAAQPVRKGMQWLTGA